jgi:hypothetical protein
MDDIEVLAAIEMLRTNPDYRAAEVLRQKMTSSAMASAPKDSDEYRAIRLMIGAWEGIAVMANSCRRKERIFEVTPVWYMHDALSGAITILERDHPGICDNFAKLETAYDKWLQTKPPKYRSACKGGMHALFG